MACSEGSSLLESKLCLSALLLQLPKLALELVLLPRQEDSEVGPQHERVTHVSVQLLAKQPHRITKLTS